MKSSKGRSIFIVVVATVIGAASMFYPEWRSIVSDFGWYSLILWVPLAAVMFWAGLAVCRLIFEVAGKWITPTIIRLLEKRK